MTTYAYKGTDRYDDPLLETCFGKRGTVTGYGRHRDKGERPCGKCADAWRKYHRKHRKEWLGDPDKRAHDRMMRAARERAKSALTKRHPGEYRALVQAEIAAVLAERRTSDDALCIECGDHRGWRVEPDWNTGEAVRVQCRACAEHVCPSVIPPGKTKETPNA